MLNAHLGWHNSSPECGDNIYGETEERKSLHHKLFSELTTVHQLTKTHGMTQMDALRAV